MSDADHSEEHHACPLSPIDRRLEDLHRHWHAAEAAYFDPDGFRVAIQTAIQTLRTVTFILQSNKKLFPDFDGWYAPWQEKLKADPLMRWMVDARNKIEKQGDLEAHSFVRAEIVASFLEEGPRIEVPAKLFDGPAVLLRRIPTATLAAHVVRHGILRIQRRWVENTLPDHELLDAVAIAYGRVAEIVRDAHEHLGLKPPQTTDTTTGEVYSEGFRAGRLPCMIGHAALRALDIVLATGEPIQIETVAKEIDLAEGEALGKRYKMTPQEMYGPGDSAEDRLRSLFAAARRMFIKDRYHVTIFWLLKGSIPIRIGELRSVDQSDKYLSMRKIADEVVKVGADGMILLGEMWSAKADPKNPYRRAAEAPDRKEFLAGTLVTNSGEPLHIAAEIIRERWRKVKLGPDRETVGGAHFLFAPLYKAWERAIPDAWIEASPVLQAEKE